MTIDLRKILEKGGNLYLLIIFVLTYTAAHYLPVFNHAMLFYLLGYMLSLVYATRFFLTRQFAFLFFYILVVLGNFALDNQYFDSYMSVLYEFTYLFLPSTMIFACSTGKVKIENRSLVLLFVIILLTTIATVWISMLFPSVVRHQNEYSEMEVADFYDRLYRFGLCNYQLPHALPCLIPAILMGLANKPLKAIVKVLLWISLIVLSLMAYFSGSFACLSLTAIGLALSMLVKKTKSFFASFLKVVFVLLVVVVFAVPSIRYGILSDLESNMDPNNDFYEKVSEFEQGEKLGESAEDGDMKGRSNLYIQSIEVGLDHFLTGTDGSDLGNHSSFFDRFATLGLVGIIPYLCFIISIISFTYKQYIPKTGRKYYLLGLFSSLFMLLFKSVNSWELWFFTLFVLPVSIYVLAPDSHHTDETVLCHNNH